MQALVFGHFGEFNDGLLKLADDISKSVAKQHHRMLGFKSEDAGRSRAKAGVMRRLSMVALRSTARHVLRGLAVVGPPCIHQHNAREAIIALFLKNRELSSDLCSLKESRFTQG